MSHDGDGTEMTAMKITSKGMWTILLRPITHQGFKSLDASRCGNIPPDCVYTPLCFSNLFGLQWASNHQARGWEWMSSKQNIGKIIREQRKSIPLTLNRLSELQFCVSVNWTPTGANYRFFPFHYGLTHKLRLNALTLPFLSSYLSLTVIPKPPVSFLGKLQRASGHIDY